jgi:hypothetical protein
VTSDRLEAGPRTQITISLVSAIEPAVPVNPMSREIEEPVISRRDVGRSNIGRFRTTKARPSWDAVVIGGGFYGCEIALELRRMGLGRVLLVEREAETSRRASFVNQARVHQGYHYPRSVQTAARSRQNFRAFVAAYRFAVRSDFINIYAIARSSQVAASQFAAFCGRVGLPCRKAPRHILDLFDPTMIEDAFVTREFVFDAAAIAASQRDQLRSANVQVRLMTTARITAALPNPRLLLMSPGMEPETIETYWAFNCTYASIEQTGVKLRAPVKKEVAEMLLIAPPRELAGIGVTVMDGSFFSTLPFPALGGYSLSHVRYTPHAATGQGEAPPAVPDSSHADAMIRDSARYLPCLRNASVVRRLFETKAILTRNEDDDGRPILFERLADNPRVVSILGGKVDNIFDALLALRELDPVT